MKRRVRIGLIVGGSLLAVMGIIVGVLNSPRVQRLIIDRATLAIEEQIHTHVAIDAVHYHFPLRCSIHGIYLEDQQGDTLLYANRIYAHLSPLALSHRHVLIHRVEIDSVRVHAYTMADSVYNYAFLIHEKEEKDSLNLPMKWRIDGKRISIQDIQIHYDTLLIRLHSATCAYSGDSTGMEVSVTDGQGDFQIDGHHQQLALSDLDIDFIYRDTVLMLPTLRIQLAHSLLDASGIRLDHPHTQPRIHLSLNEFTLIPSDLSALIPALNQLHEPVRMQGQIDGFLDSVKATNLTLFYGKERVFLGNCSAVGLPNMKHTHLYAECQDLSLHVDKVEHLIANLTHRPCLLPAEVHRLGNVHYRGVAKGRLNHFQLDGAFTTPLGTITTHGTCVSDSDFQSCVIRSDIAVHHFQLGQMLGNKDIGLISTEMNTELHLSTSRPPRGKARLVVSDFSFRDYDYEQLSVEGRFDDHAVAVTLGINDPNLSLALQADGNWNENTTSYLHAQIALHHCFPGALQWSTGQFAHSGWATQIRLDQSYSHNNHLIGSLIVDSTFIQNQDAQITLPPIRVSLDDKDDYQYMEIESQLISGVLTGRFDIRHLKDMVLRQMAIYVPSLFTEKEATRLRSLRTDMRFEYSLLGPRIHAVQEVLQLPVMVSDNFSIMGYYNDDEQQWGVETHIPGIVMGNGELHDVSLRADNGDNKANVHFSMEMDSALFGMHLVAFEDSVWTRLLIDALPPYTNHGDIRILTHFSHYAGLPLIQAHILPGSVQLADSIYHINPGSVTYTMADSTIVFRDVRFHGHSQFIAINGIASSQEADSLLVELGHINLGLIMPFVLPAQTLSIGGYASGWVNLYSLFKAPMFEAQVQVDSTLFNGAQWGTVQAQVGLDRTTKNILIEGGVTHHHHQTAVVHGVAEPKNKHFQIDVETDSIPLSFIEHWTHAFLRDITGTVSGHVAIIGEGKKTWVLTHAKPNDASVMIPFTGCRYFVNDTIIMDSTSIRFPHLHMHDTEGNPLTFEGILTHNDYFRDFHLDLHAHCEHTLAFDLPDNSNQLMNGQVYATGKVDLTGPDNDIQLFANAMAVGKSHFQLSLGTTSSARDNSFVDFVRHDQPVLKDTISHFIPKRKSKLFARGASRFRLGMNLDIDPQTLFQLVLDERTGDMIEARGDGSIKFSLDDATDDIQLVGTYTISSGKMGFTIGNLIRRDFTIEDGSQIIWNGRAEQPILDVTAKYQVTASLKDLFGSETEHLVSGRTTVPVATMIHLTGSLDDPIIRFSIELPKSEDHIENQVKAIINTEEMMMREVVYLLVFGKFFTPEYVKTSTSSTTLNSTYALLSSTITGQINSWLGKLTNVFTLGFNIRSEGTDQKAAQEYEAVFQLQPVDRLIINGNFGYRYNDVSNRPFFGDLDIECLLTPNGKYRLKGYTHTVDKYSLKQASTIQGIGFLFRHDFNWRRTEEEKELREAQKAAKAAERSRKKNEKNQKKEEQK